MRRDHAKLALLAGLAALAAWLWLTRSGRSTARRVGVATGEGAFIVTEAAKSLLDRALAWLISLDAKANLRRLWPTIESAANAVGMPPLVLARVAYIESAFRTDVLNKSVLGRDGEIGITQVIPKWHPTIDLSTPETQLVGTAKTLAAFARQFGGRWDAAVAAWNAGPNAVKNALATGPAWRTKLPAVTQDYLRKLDEGVA